MLGCSTWNARHRTQARGMYCGPRPAVSHIGRLRSSGGRRCPRRHGGGPDGSGVELLVRGVDTSPRRRRARRQTRSRPRLPGCLCHHQGVTFEVPRSSPPPTSGCTGNGSGVERRPPPAGGAPARPQWGLAVEGPVMHGRVALVVYVRRGGAPAALNVQPIGSGAPRGGSGVAHLGRPRRRACARGRRGRRRLDPAARAAARRPYADGGTRRRPCGGDHARLLARLHSHTGPAGVRSLSSVVDRMLHVVPEAVTKLEAATDAGLVREWAHRLAELAGTEGDRLLHWDLHYENVLAAEREPCWPSISSRWPRSGFDLLPALHNRWRRRSPSVIPRVGCCVDSTS